MSHIKTITWRVTDLHALDAACQTLGVELRRDQKTYRSYYGERACEHAIRVSGSEYEIGLNKDPDGPGLIPIYDEYGVHGRAIHATLGSNLFKLVQETSAEVATRHRGLKREGFTVQSREYLDNGSLRVRLVQR